MALSGSFGVYAIVRAMRKDSNLRGGHWLLMTGAVLTVIVLCAALWLSSHSGYVPPRASRSADSGCMWGQGYQSKRLGIEFLNEICDSNGGTLSFQEQGNTIVALWSYKNGAYASPPEPLIEVFQKAPDESDKEAVMRVAGQDFTPYQKAHCVVETLPAFNDARGSDFMHFNDQSKIGYVVTPDVVYENKISAETQQGDIPEPGCGAYGFYADALSYFEFHPQESTRTFIFLSPRQDFPPFDEQSIRFIR